MNHQIDSLIPRLMRIRGRLVFAHFVFAEFSSRYEALPILEHKRAWRVHTFRSATGGLDL